MLVVIAEGASTPPTTFDFQFVWKMVVDVLGLLIGLLAALGSIAVACLAIWGDAVRDRFYGPTIEIKLKSDVGQAVGPPGEVKVYYHFEVSNHRQSAPARNCRVLLRRIDRMDAGGEFRQVLLPFDCGFFWTPANRGEETRQIVFGQPIACDFGYLNKDGFHLSITTNPAGRQSVLEGNGCIKYQVVVVADNFADTSERFFKVTWDGRYDGEPKVVAGHLTIEQIQPASRKLDGLDLIMPLFRLLGRLVVSIR
jgi:hypothetical protein